MHVEGVNVDAMRTSDIGRITDAAYILLRKEYLGNRKYADHVIF